jgi:hypothetical protein
MLYYPIELLLLPDTINEFVDCLSHICGVVCIGFIKFHLVETFAAFQILCIKCTLELTFYLFQYGLISL